MCSGSKPKVQAAPAAPPPPAPPPEVAPSLDIATNAKADKASTKNNQQKKGRSSLRVQRQAGVGGASFGAGLSIPQG